jgi:hypothetical protein
LHQLFYQVHQPVTAYNPTLQSLVMVFPLLRPGPGECFQAASWDPVTCHLLSSSSAFSCFLVSQDAQRPRASSCLAWSWRSHRALALRWRMVLEPRAWAGHAHAAGVLSFCPSASPFGGFLVAISWSTWFLCAWWVCILCGQPPSPPPLQAVCEPL